MNAVVITLSLALAASEPSPPPLVPHEEKPKVEASAELGRGATVQYGDFSLNLRGLLQVQGLFVMPEQGTTAASAQTTIFARRARLSLRGTAPHQLTYQFLLGFSSSDLEADAPNPLLDAWLQWAALRDLSFRAGQMNVAFDVQQPCNAGSLQMVEISGATSEFRLERDVGLVAYSENFLGWGDRLQYAVGVFGGEGRNRIGLTPGMLFSARVRFSPLGRLDDRVEGDGARTPTPRFAIGASVAHNSNSNRPRSTMGTPFKLPTGFDYTHATADLYFKWRGASLLGEFYLREVDPALATGASQPVMHEGLVGNAMVTEYSRSGMGWFVQGGYYVFPWLELVARYGAVRPAAGTDPRFAPVREFVGTVNVMFQGHDLKLQTDYAYLDDGQGQQRRHVVRVQAQIFF